MSISRKEMLMSLAQSSEKGYKMRQGSDMARFNESFMDTVKSVGKAAYDTGKYMVTGELPGAGGMKPGQALPSKEEQRKEQDATQTGFGGLEKTINATETGTRVAKALTDVGMQAVMPGIGGAVATGIDLVSAGAAHAMGQDDARDYALKSAGANAIGAVAGGVGKAVADAARVSAPGVANVAGVMAKEGTKQTLNNVTAALAPKENKPKVAMEAYNAKRLSVILETIGNIMEIGEIPPMTVSPKTAAAAKIKGKREIDTTGVAGGDRSSTGLGMNTTRPSSGGVSSRTAGVAQGERSSTGLGMNTTFSGY